MKKKLVSLALTLILSAGLVFSAVAAESFKVSTAIDCIAEDVTLVKSAPVGEDVSFRLSDFRQALGVSAIDTVTVTALPDPQDGILKLSNLRVSVGQTIKAENIELLRFVPAGEMTESAVFRFVCDGYSGGAELACSLLFTDRENVAPTAAAEGDSVAVSTQASVALYGILSGSDADGDALSFQIVSYPKNGTLSLLDAAYGSYRYKPISGYTGEDSFTYVVRDTHGYYSHVATVNIEVRESDTGYVYADMDRHTSHNAALTVSASGVMTGTTVKGVHSFSPEKTMTRAEFTVAAMKAAGIVSLGIGNTAFEDNDAIKASLRPYIATAHVVGIVNGSLTEDGLFFRPNDPITRAEAAMILVNAFDVPLPDTVLTFAEEAAVPTWAKPAVSALSTLGILDVSADAAATERMTRADAAECLAAAMEQLLK